MDNRKYSPLFIDDNNEEEIFNQQQPKPHRTRRRSRVLLFLLAIALAGVFLILIFKTPHKILSNTAAKLISPLDYKNETITLKSVLKGKFYPKTFNGTFINDTHVQYYSANGDLLLFNVLHRTVHILIPSIVFAQTINHRPFECKLSPSGRFVLVAYDPQKVYRHSVFALYDVYDTQTGTFTSLQTTQGERRIQLALWSATSDSVAFVQANNIYYKEIGSDSTPYQVTKDGSHFIYNGVTDWVYEEEMFSSNVGVWLNEENLAYVTFNDTLVDSIQFSLYGDPGNPQFQYPILEAIPYPKSGRMNPTARVSVFNLKTKETKEIILPNSIPFEHYIGRVKWSKSNNLLVTVLNRNQNQTWILSCNSICQILHSIEQKGGWLDVNDIFEYENNSFLMLASQYQSSNALSYHHIINFDENSIVKTLSRGEFSVETILGVNKDKIYFRSGLIKEERLVDPGESHLYELSNGNIKCLTCDICSSHLIEMSKGNCSYFVHTCSYVAPIIYLRDVKNTTVITLEKNNDLAESLEYVALPVAKKYDIPIGNFTIKAKLWVPHDFDETKTYPLLLDVYGGPNSIKNTEKYTIDWGMSLVSSKGIIYGSIDGRGSGKQSDDFMFQVYKRLGTVEIEDQIYAAKWLLDKLSWLDKEKVGIWGWSYGGFVTAMVMGTDLENVFKCGISVAPVSNWAFYDTIYTERYLGLPMDNFPAYNRSDVTNHIDNFRNKKYLLVHGNADDNVHYQQSMVLARALEKADILFQQQSYPDENHGLGGVRRHLYHTLENFIFNQCFYPFANNKD